MEEEKTHPFYTYSSVKIPLRDRHLPAFQEVKKVSNREGKHLSRSILTLS